LGDPSERLARTYHELKHELLTVCVHLAGGRAAGEDLLQDVFVAFARRAQGPSSLPSLATRHEMLRYLVASCVHRARDLKRRRVESGPLEEIAAHDGDPLAQSAAADESDQVHAALRELPDEQREVVTLHLHGGLKFREIAEATGVPLDTATSRYRYALEKLRRRLIAKGVT